MPSNRFPKLEIHNEFPETSPLPPRVVDWIEAWRLFKYLQTHTGDVDAAFRFTMQTLGGYFEQMFQSFLKEPGARNLLKERPELSVVLADLDTLAAMPESSLGRAVLAFTQRFGYTANGLIEAADREPSFQLIAPDHTRQWFFKRIFVSHDVYHTITGYGQDDAGEVALIAFSMGAIIRRVPLARYQLVTSMLLVPRDHWFRNMLYMHQAFQHGLRSSLGLDCRIEELLPRPLEEARRILQIQPLEAVHPDGIMVGSMSRPWTLKATDYVSPPDP